MATLVWLLSMGGLASGARKCLEGTAAVAAGGLVMETRAVNASCCPAAVCCCFAARAGASIEYGCSFETPNRDGACVATAGSASLVSRVAGQSCYGLRTGAAEVVTCLCGGDSCNTLKPPDFPKPPTPAPSTKRTAAPLASSKPPQELSVAALCFCAALALA